MDKVMFSDIDKFPQIQEYMVMRSQMKAYQERFGLSDAELDILLFLLREPLSNAVSIIEALSLNRGWVFACLRRLKTKDLVQRDQFGRWSISGIGKVSIFAIEAIESK